ncbi:MAG: sigma-E factor negative regulatory protein [Rhodocyclaceae bacterium]|nr:sigma-E factor negative regulatory protein [Rhodocyclaceae bacterium]
MQDVRARSDERLSALYDGEIESDEFAALARRLGDEILQRQWVSYVMIGEGLRGKPACCDDFTAKVMARLEHEPIVFAPHPLRPGSSRPHPWLALAASVAGVAVVGWLAWIHGLEEPRRQSEAVLATAPVLAPAAHMPSGQTKEKKPTRVELVDYVVAHHVEAPGIGVSLGGNVHHVRTVSMITHSERP